MPAAVVADTPDRVRNKHGSEALIAVCDFFLCWEAKRTLCLSSGSVDSALDSAIYYRYEIASI